MANAVRSSVLPRNPSAAPPVHAPGVGSAASAYPLPLEAVSATVNPATSIHRAAEPRSEEHTSELQSLRHLVCRLLLEKKTHHPDETRRAQTYHQTHPGL